MKIVLQYWHWVLLLASLCGVALCIILLLNFTAANPTKRRYASEKPLTSGTPKQIGDSAEEILSEDLGLPNNNDTNQRHCICNRNSLLERQFCNACFASLSLSVNYRLPDFVAENQFLAESKNVRQLRAPSDEYMQLQDYASAAQNLDIPLWVYVRTNTQVDTAYDDLVEKTGGDVVYYFPTSDYQDITDQWAGRGLLFFGLTGATALFRIWQLRRQTRQRVRIRVISEKRVN